MTNDAPVTAERLANPQPGEWLSIRRTYDGQSHSPLTEITAENNLPRVYIYIVIGKTNID